MEDALVLNLFGPNGGGYEGLNPCFNGRCTRTKSILTEEKYNLLS